MDGRILYLNLDDETIREERVSGFSVSSLYAMVDAQSFAFAFPSSVLALAVFISPQDHRLVRFAAACRLAGTMSRLGITALIVRGMSHKLSYLYASDDDLSIYHCENIRFSSARRFAQVLCSSSEDGHLAIGEAGERQSPLASCIVDTGLSIGCGLAAVMGAANFKGIVSHTASPAAAAETLPARKGLMKELSVYGGISLVDYGLSGGWLPVKYYQGYYDPRCSNLDGRTACRIYNVEHRGCQGCTASCLLFDASRQTSLPSWKDAAALGSNLGIFSLQTVTLLADKCRDCGLDTVDTGAVLACLMQREDLPYTFPSIAKADTAELERVLSLIAARKGCGELVSGGLSVLEDAVSLSGRSVAYDLRGAHAQALFCLLGETTACHADLVYNLKARMDDEQTGRAAAWLRLLVHAFENSGRPAIWLLAGSSLKRWLPLMTRPFFLRRMMLSLFRRHGLDLVSALESVDSFDAVFGPIERLPQQFSLPSVVGYTDEVNIVKLTLGYSRELDWIRSNAVKVKKQSVVSQP